MENVLLYAANINELIGDEAFIAKALCAVTPERAERYHRIRDEKGKLRTLAAELLLRIALSENAGNIPLEFEYKGNGKPYLKNCNDVFFNISHSGDMVICALSPREVGCDIEEIREGSRSLKIADKYFTEEERAWISERRDDSFRRFYRIWTLKESYMKVRGQGLALPLNSFSIVMPQGHTVSPRHIQVIHQPETDSVYRFREFTDFPGYCCSICSDECNIDDNVRKLALKEMC